MDALLPLLILVALLATWATSLRARERALKATAEACKELGTELLDETVELTGIRPVWEPSGRIYLQRRYGFEFTPDGQQRLRGWLVLAGLEVDSLQFEFPEGLTLVEGGTSRRGLRA